MKKEKQVLFIPFSQQHTKRLLNELKWGSFNKAISVVAAVGRVCKHDWMPRVSILFK